MKISHTNVETWHPISEAPFSTRQPIRPSSPCGTTSCSRGAPDATRVRRGSRRTWAAPSARGSASPSSSSSSQSSSPRRSPTSPVTTFQSDYCKLGQMDTVKCVGPPIPFVYWFGFQTLRRHMCCRAIKTILIGVHWAIFYGSWINDQSLFKFWPKWSNFAKSGLTGRKVAFTLVHFA